MFDTNVFDSLLAGNLMFHQFTGVEAIATHVQRDEIEDIPVDDPLRSPLLEIFRSSVREVIETSVAVFDVSKWDQSRYGTPEQNQLFEKMRNELIKIDKKSKSKLNNQTRDILIAVTAHSEDCELITSDKKLAEIANKNGIKVTWLNKKESTEWEKVLSKFMRSKGVASITGGCQCGAIRFSTTELLDNAHICHCRMCQKAVGNYFAALVSTPKDQLTWTRGTPARFKSSGDVERGFCANCGTPLFFDPFHSQDIGLCIGALDNPQNVKPISQDSIESRMPWFVEIIQVPDSGTSEELDGPARVAEVASTNRQHPDHDTEFWPPRPVD